MKVLTAAQMREVDRLTIERGIPGLILMENAGHRVVELLASRFAPLSGHRIVVMCGKGNNGGDGLVVARQLHTRFHPRSLHVVLVADPAELGGDAAENFRMLTVCGCPYSREVTAEMRLATLVIDGLLGTGIKGPATGVMLESIREINSGFPLAKVVAIDIPSGMPSDSGAPVGEFVRADYTVTFTALKVSQAMPPNCDRMGELHVAPIGSPPELYEDIPLSLVEPRQFAGLLAPRSRDANKGDFGHVLVIGGAHGKIGAAAMAGLSSLRAGAGLVTVACSELNLTAVAPVLMTAPLPNPRTIASIVERKDVIAIGPGLGSDPEMVSLTRSLFTGSDKPMVVDADGLNALSVGQIPDLPGNAKLRVLTPHPGEMSRLTGKTVAAIQADRLDAARALSTEKKICLVLKGERTLIAFPDGRVWINPTGTPAMATGGTGDILTGMVAGFLGQFPNQPDLAIAAAVYLHGLAGELGAASKGEKPLIATDLLDFLPAAIHACANVSDEF
jgi:ADP-dependent NAD(P)H-hydrate dehydratase / NAD(P)H-hydrate epimerase